MQTTFYLPQLNLSKGTYSITARAKASGYADSKESNAVIYGVVDLVYTLSDDGTYYICSKKGTSTVTDIIISSDYNGLPVTSIGERAFYKCTSLTSVTIPDSITSIGIGAFEGCTNLAYNAYDNAYYLGNNDNPYIILVKSKNTSISSCGIKRVRFIHSNAFDDCRSLTSVTIPDSVTSIGDEAFKSCLSLTSVTIPDSVTSIGEWAFFNCYGLTSVTIPNSVSRIERGTFASCTHLQNVTIPNSVTSIGWRAFVNCSRLISVTIGNGVTSIDDEAFKDCDNLKTVYYNGTREQWDKITIGSNNDDLIGANIICTVSC